MRGQYLPGVGAVLDPEVGDPLLNLVVDTLVVWECGWLRHLIKDLLRGEAHGVHVVGPGGELLPGGEHVLDRAAETVVNVHHGQARVRAEVALVPPAINAITHQSKSARIIGQYRPACLVVSASWKICTA